VCAFYVSEATWEDSGVGNQTDTTPLRVINVYLFSRSITENRKYQSTQKQAVDFLDPPSKKIKYLVDPVKTG